MPSPGATPPDLLARAARIRLACFDVDGTLTDGRLFFDSEGRESKAFHVHDGQGLALLRKAGIAVAFVTARAGSIIERRAAELGAEAHVGIADKRACVEAIAQRLGVGLDAVSFMGDDLPDLRVMPHVGLSVAPCDAHAWVRDRVHWRTAARGGFGAARELCDLLLAAQGHDERLLAEFAGTERAR
ncbi:phenylphosphate carboxylase subunit delta [Tolypothrix campylonemoides VB511288]|nr:phenylphosphate carboxylase subunit delta [Tolypothrix campylonemoides VB511288]